MAKIATKSTNRVAKKTVRQRRSFGPRNSRTYYAISPDQLTLHRFQNHITRENAIKTEGLQHLSAMDFRIKQLEDVEHKLVVVDHRNTNVEPNSSQVTVQDSQSQEPQLPEKSEILEKAITKEEFAQALDMFRQGIGVLASAMRTQPIVGETRIPDRQVPSH